MAREPGYASFGFFAELSHEGRLSNPDPVTGGPSAIGPGDPAFTARSGHARTPANGSDFPERVRSRDREAQEGIREAAARLHQLCPQWSRARRSFELLQLIAGRLVNDDARLTHAIARLRETIPVVSSRCFDGLPEMHAGAEFHVFASSDGSAVYKLSKGYFPPGEGGGWLPGVLAREGPGFIFERGANPTLLDIIERIGIANAHGGFVYTEIAAVTDDGRLLLKQPAIHPATPSNNKTRAHGLPPLGITVIDPQAEATNAVIAATGEHYAVGDLHEFNAVIVPEVGMFVLDFSMRPLDADEARRLGLK